MKNLKAIVEKRKSTAKNDQASAGKGTTAVVRASDRMVATIALYKALSATSQAIATTRQHLRDFGQVKALAEVVESEGMSRGLAKFANFDGAAEGLFEGFPATESLDAVALAADDPRNTGALEGILAVAAMEADAASADTASVVNGLMATLKTFCDDLDYREDMGEKLTSELAEVELSDDQLTGVTVNAVSADARKVQFEKLTAVGGAMADAPNFKDVTTEDLKAIQDNLASAVEHLTGVTGLAIDEDGVVIDDAENISDDYIISSGTLTDKGYSVESLKALVHQMLGLTEVFENVRENLEAIGNGFMSAIPAAAENDGEDEGENEDSGDANGATDDDDETAGDDDGSDEAGATEGDEGGDTDGEGDTGDDGENDGTSDNEDDGADQEEEAAMASEAEIAATICGFATVIAAVVDSATIAMTSVIEIGETVSELAAASDEDPDGDSDQDEDAGDTAENDEDKGGDSDGGDSEDEGDEETAGTDEAKAAADAAAETTADATADTAEAEAEAAPTVPSWGQPRRLI